METIADLAAAFLGTASIAIAIYALSPLLAVMVLPVVAPIAFMNITS